MFELSEELEVMKGSSRVALNSNWEYLLAFNTKMISLGQIPPVMIYMTKRENFLTALERIGGENFRLARKYYELLRMDFVCLGPWKKFLENAYARLYPINRDFNEFCRRLYDALSCLYQIKKTGYSPCESEKCFNILRFYDLGLSVAQICAIFEIDLPTFRRISRSRASLSKKFLKSLVNKNTKKNPKSEILSEIKKLNIRAPNELWKIVRRYVPNEDCVRNSFLESTKWPVLNMETGELLKKLREKFPNLTVRKLYRILRNAGICSLSQYKYKNKFFTDFFWKRLSLADLLASQGLDIKFLEQRSLVPNANTCKRRTLDWIFSAMKE